MRIISGTAKGKKLLIPIDKKTRPLKEMVRESIFNILYHSKLTNKSLNNSIILDLFSGIGSFGLEAISRGAKKVIFYENYNPAYELLKKNIKNLSFDNRTEVFRGNIYDKKNINFLKQKFDIIFIDPPFKDNIDLLLNNLITNKISNSKTLVILHRHKKTKDNFDKNFIIQREETYGSSKIIFGFFNL